MRKVLGFSILLNVVLLAGLAFILKNPRPKESVVVPVLPQVQPRAQATTASAVPPPAGMETASFQWSQLTSANDYRLYIANLRAIGCPEATIGDIVRGDTERVFAWERNQLALDESGTGPWSRQAEKQLVADLLALPESTAGSQNSENSNDLNHGDKKAGAIVPSQNGQSGTVRYPLFVQNVDWTALGFTADQQAVISQVRQQFQNDMNGANELPGGTANSNLGATEPAGTLSNPGSGGTSAPTQGQTALQNATDQLQTLLGADGYAAYEQRQYYAWYQPQVLANADGGNLTINPQAFSSK